MADQVRPHLRSSRWLPTQLKPAQHVDASLIAMRSVVFCLELPLLYNMHVLLRHPTCPSPRPRRTEVTPFEDTIHVDSFVRSRRRDAQLSTPQHPVCLD